MMATLSAPLAAAHRRVAGHDGHHAAIWRRMESLVDGARTIHSNMHHPERLGLAPYAAGPRPVLYGNVLEASVLITSVVEQVRRQSGRSVPRRLQAELLREGSQIISRGMAMSRAQLNDAGHVRSRLITDILRPGSLGEPPLLAEWKRGGLAIRWDPALTGEDSMCVGPLPLNVHGSHGALLAEIGAVHTAITGQPVNYGPNGTTVSPAHLLWGLAVPASARALEITPARLDRGPHLFRGGRPRAGASLE
jgi:hypothetical protein